jgi:hypothetical protein
MDIGKIKNNHIYYDGYEGETEIVLSINESKDLNMHVWEGYFDDIFGEPSLVGDGWRGFTRDIHQMERIFSNEEFNMIVDVSEYLEDLITYKDKTFRYEESAEVLNMLITFFEYVKQNDFTVTVDVI